MRRLFLAGAVLAAAAISSSASGQDYFLTVAPEQISVVAGGEGQVAVQVVGSGGFNSAVSIQMPAIPDVTFTPASFTQLDGGITIVVVDVSSGASARTVPVTFQGSVPGIGNRNCTFQLTIIGASDFLIEATPRFISLEAGDEGGATLEVAATALNGFAGLISVSAPTDLVVDHGPNGGLTFEPSTFILSPSQPSQSVKIAAGARLTPGHRAIVFSALAPGVDGVRTTAPVDLEIRPPRFGALPEIEALDPPALIQGARSQIVRAYGRNFVAGASAVVEGVGIAVERLTIVNSTTADLTLSVTRDLTPGPYRIDIRNPDGGASEGGPALLVYSPDSLGAPLSVIAAAIVYPAEGAIVPTDRPTQPRAVIATAGTGVITGTWRVSGVPFDRFSVDVAGGEPAEIVANAPIPHLSWGANELELTIDFPRVERVASIRIIGAPTSATALKLSAPADRAIVEERRPLFRWSLVPGADGYEIEIVRVAENGEPSAESLLVRVADAEWRPTDARRDEIGDGVFQWRVRAIFPGGVRGQATAWRTMVLTPRKVTLLPRDTDGRLVAFEGGRPGLLYRFDIFKSDQRILAAMSFHPSYDVPADVVGSVDVTVTALTPSGIVVGSATHAGKHLPAALPAASPPETSLQEVFPAHGSLVADARPRIGARVDRVTRKTLVLLVDGVDVAPLARIGRRGVEYRPVVPLTDGIHEVKLSHGRTAATWTFTTRATNALPAPRRVEYVFTPAATIDWDDGRDAVVRVQTSTQGDLRDARGEAKYTGDVSWRATADPATFAQESRNWLVKGVSPQRTLRVGATVGLTTPAFTAGGEYLGTGLARQSVAARVSSRFGSVSYYQPTDDAMPGAVSIRDRAPLIRTFALETPEGKDSFLRLIAVEVGELRAIGILGSRRIGPRLKIDVEAARGENTLSSGEALRLGVNGTVARTRYGLTLRHTDTGYVNPAHRGLSRGSFSDRTSADLLLSRAFGVKSLNLTMRRIESGQTSQTATTMQFRMPLPRSMALTVASNVSLDESPASGRLPHSERILRGLTLTLQRSIAKLTLMQTVGYQSTDDRVNRSGDRDVTSMSTSLSGNLTTNVAWMTNISGTRSDNAFGRQDNVNALVRPTIALAGGLLKLIPSLTWQRSSGAGSSNVTRQARATAEWTCPRCVFSLQLSSGWIRNDSSFARSQTSREVRFALALKIEKEAT